MSRIAGPVLLVLLTVLTYVGVAAWNRSGPPPLTLTVTERELTLPPAPATPHEDAGVQLHLRHEARTDPLDARNWLPDARLREIGFDLEVPAGAPRAADAYDNMPSRLAWVVLEYDGPAYQALERQRALHAKEDETGQGPRLVPVDAGVDLEALRRRYPAGHLIMPAVIGVGYLPPDAGGPLVYGRLERIVGDPLAVPSRLRPLFDAWRANPDADREEPRYEVEIALGRLGLPYVRSARRLP